MRPSSAARFNVPSTSVLKYLRKQSETCFFTTNSSPSLSLECKTPRKTGQHVATSRYVRCLSTSNPRRATVQAPCLDSVGVQRWNGLGNMTSFVSQSTRYASTKSVLNQLWKWRDPKWKKYSAYSDLPDSFSHEDSTQFLNLSRSIARTGAGADSKLRCTEFDVNGSVVLVSGEFKKSELIAKYGLLPRDLRKIDSSLLPNIMVRKSAILLNLLHLRVLIQSDRVLVFDAYGSTDSYTQSLFMYDLEGKLRQKTDARSSTYLPYEFRALEAVLISVTSGLESEFEGVREPVVRVLRELEEDIDRDKLRHLLIHSKKLGSFEQKARLVRDAINDLLEADDELVQLYLTERAQGKERDVDDHQEAEMLLESYYKICDEIVEISGNLISNIRNTEEVVKAILDANRNSLMLLDIKFSIGTLGLAAGTLFAGLYGMNLKNFFEESDFAFTAVSAMCMGISAVVGIYGMKKLGKVQRVRMWGEGYGSAYGTPTGLSRGNWRNEALEHAGRSQAGLAKLRAERMRSLNERRADRVLWPAMDGLGSNTEEMEEAAESKGNLSPSAGSSSTPPPVPKPPKNKKPPLVPVKK